MPGKQIGKLSIRVLPDSSKFREDMRVLVDEAEARYKVHIPVEADTAEAKAKIREFVDDESGRKIKLGVNLNSGDASERLALLARDRTSRIRVDVDRNAIEKAAQSLRSLSAAATPLAALSGLRLLGNVFGEIREKLLSLDEAVPAISRVALGIATLTSGLLSSAAGLITVGGDIARIFNLVALAPALFVGFAVGITALIVALKDTGTQLASLGPAFGRLRDVISDNFWQRARQPILDFVNGILPQLNTGFARVATALGNQIGALATAFGRAFGGGVLLGWLNTISRSMDIITLGAQSVASGFVTLGTVGLSYMPRLAAYLVQVADGFNNWIQASANSGALAGYIEAGITSVKLFASALGSAASILAGLNRAAEAAGSGGLYTLAATLSAVAQTVNSGVFQTALTRILTGAGAAMRSLGAGLGDLVRTFGALAPQIQAALTIAGATVGRFISAIAAALNQPAIKQGLVDLFTGIQDGVAGLATALPTVGRILGQLGTAIGALARSFGPLIAAFKNAFGPILEALIPIAQDLAVALSGVLTDAIKSLAGPLAGLGRLMTENKGAFTIIAGAVVILAGVFAAVVAAIGPVVGAFGSITTVVGALATVFGAISGPIAIAVGAIVAIGLALVAFFTQTQLGRDIVGTFIDYLSTAFQNISNFLGPIFRSLGDLVTTVVTTWQTGFAKIGQAIAPLLEQAKPVFDGITTAVQSFADGVSTGLGYVSNAVSGVMDFFTSTVAPVLADVFSTIAAKVTEFVAFLQQAWTAVQPAVQPVVDFFVNTVGPHIGDVLKVLGIGLGILAGVISVVFVAPLAAAALVIAGFIAVVVGIIAVVTGVVTAVTTAITFLRGVWETVFNALGPIVQTAFSTVQQVVTTVISTIQGAVSTGLNVIRATFATVFNAVVVVVTTVFATIRTAITIGITAAQTAVTVGLNMIRNTFTTVFNAVVSTVTSVFNTIRSAVQSALSAITSAVSAGMSAVRAAFSSALSAVQSAVSSAFNAVVSTVRSAVSAFVGAISEGVGRAASTFRTLGPQIIGALSGIAGQALSAGRAIVQGLINGILSMLGAVASAAARVASAVASVLPHSPAKAGPFSGRGWPAVRQSGVAIVKQVRDGLVDSRALLESALDGVDITSKVKASALDAISTATRGGRIEVASSVVAPDTESKGDSIVVQGNVGYDPAQIARELALKKQQAALRAGYTKVAFG